MMGERAVHRVEGVGDIELDWGLSPPHSLWGKGPFILLIVEGDGLRRE